MIGYHKRNGAVVVALVVGPDSDSRHEHAHFALDPENLQQTLLLMATYFGAEFCGNFHTHLRAFGPNPSSGDDASIKSLCLRNNLSQLVTVIATHEFDHGIESLKNSFVRLNAFLYTNPQNNGNKKRIPIKILPGISPLRQAILSCGDPQLTCLCRHAGHMPLERIRYDRYEPGKTTTTKQDVTEQFPSEILRQIETLDSRAQKNVTLRVEGKSITVSFNVYKDQRVTVYYHNRTPYDIYDATLDTNGKTEPLCFKQTPCDLLQIYRLMRNSRSRLNKVIHRKCKRRRSKKNKRW